MRVLFLNHNLAWRGGFFRAYHWGRHLVHRGHQVTLLTISESRRLRFDVRDQAGIRLVSTPDLMTGRLRSGWDPWDSLRRIQFLLPLSFDLVHSVDSRPVSIIPALVLKKFKRAKLVVDWGDWWGRGGTIVEREGGLADRIFSPIETFFEEAFRRYADGSVVLSSALEQRAIALGVSPPSIVRIPHGADVEGIVPLDKRTARDAVGVEQQGKLIGYVGVLFKSDADLMFQAFREVCRRDSTARLVVIGNANYTVPQELIDSGRVLKTGHVTYKRLQEWIACCDLMWLPLRDTLANRGRWPSKICDYLAAGKPVVATRVGDVASLIEEGECGLVTGSEFQDLANGTMKVLVQNSSLETMSCNARRVAEARLDWKILTDQLEHFYSKVLSN